MYTDIIMSHKFQITLPDDLAEELRAEAARAGVPLAELIRDTMRERLRRTDVQTGATPLDAITGIVGAGETDLAERVDETLYR